MHVVADTYAHKSYKYNDKTGKWEHLTPTDVRSDKAEGYARFMYAKYAVNNVLNVWNKKKTPSFLEYNVQGHSKIFRIRSLYNFSIISPNGINFYNYDKAIARLSY